MPHNINAVLTDKQAELTCAGARRYCNSVLSLVWSLSDYASSLCDLVEV